MSPAKWGEEYISHIYQKKRAAWESGNQATAYTKNRKSVNYLRAGQPLQLEFVASTI